MYVFCLIFQYLRYCISDINAHFYDVALLFYFNCSILSYFINLMFFTELLGNLIKNNIKPSSPILEEVSHSLFVQGRSDLLSDLLDVILNQRWVNLIILIIINRCHIFILYYYIHLSDVISLLYIVLLLLLTVTFPLFLLQYFYTLSLTLYCTVNSTLSFSYHCS